MAVKWYELLASYHGKGGTEQNEKQSSVPVLYLHKHGELFQFNISFNQQWLLLVKAVFSAFLAGNEYEGVVKLTREWESAESAMLVSFADTGK